MSDTGRAVPRAKMSPQERQARSQLAQLVNQQAHKDSERQCDLQPTHHSHLLVFARGTMFQTNILRTASKLRPRSLVRPFISPGMSVGLVRFSEYPSKVIASPPPLGSALSSSTDIALSVGFRRVIMGAEWRVGTSPAVKFFTLIYIHRLESVSQGE